MFENVKIPESSVPKFGPVEWLLLRIDRTGELHYRYCLWRIKHRKFVWKCERVGGGGTLRSPKLRQDKAEDWLMAHIPNGEIIYVDDTHKFIFYETGSK